MVRIIVDLKKGLPRAQYGVLGIGSFNWDYILTCLYTNQTKGRIKLRKGHSFQVVNKEGQELLRLSGPYTADSLKKPLYEVVIDDKHKSGKDNPSHLEKLVLGQDVEKRAGGGIVNLARAFLVQSTEIPFGLITLRGERKLEKLVEGTYHQFINVGGQNDQSNLVFPGINTRTVIRGKPIIYKAPHIYLNPDFEFLIGTIVINSLDSKILTEAAIDLYKEKMDNHEYIRGIIAITPKMENSYKLIAKKAIPKGFIPIFSPLDLIKYAFRGSGRNVLKKCEEDITYSEIFEAIQIIRKEQKGRNQRIYITLGGYGSIGVGTNGSVYRVDVFNAWGHNKTGAGDVFASSVTKYEHKRFLNMEERRPIYEVLAYASAASALHINGYCPHVAEIHQKLLSERDVRYETLGNIDTLDPQCKNFKKKIAKVVNGPISGFYSKIRFT